MELKVNSREYQAFISYRHADNKQQGRQWATWLHQALEAYEVPADLVGKTNARGDILSERIFPIFRDEEELPANADLANSITGALDQSGLLIVLCSPNAVASTYVAKEIRYFKQIGNSDRIIAVIIDGEPNASWDVAKQSAGISKDSECFPLPLQFHVNENGELTNVRAEPVAADFRVINDGVIEQGWTTPGAYSQHLKISTQLDNTEIDKKVSAYQQQQHLMLLKIVAGILSVPLGELTQRDKEFQLARAKQKAKSMRRWLTTIAVFAVVAFCTALYALNQRSLALLRLDSALISESFYLKELASQKIKEDKNIFEAVGYLAKALPGRVGGDRPFVQEVYESLYSTITQNKVPSLFFEVKPDFNSHVIDAFNVSTLDKLLALHQDRSMSVWNSKTGRHERNLDGYHIDAVVVGELMVSVVGRGAEEDELYLEVVNLKTGEVASKKIDSDLNPMNIKTNSDASIIGVAVCERKGERCFLDVYKTDSLNHMQRIGMDGYGVKLGIYSFSYDKKYLGIYNNKAISFYRISDFEQVGSAPFDKLGLIQDFAYLPMDNKFVVVGEHNLIVSDIGGGEFLSVDFVYLDKYFYSTVNNTIYIGMKLLGENETLINVLYEYDFEYSWPTTYDYKQEVIFGRSAAAKYYVMDGVVKLFGGIQQGDVNFLLPVGSVLAADDNSILTSVSEGVILWSVLDDWSARVVSDTSSYPRDVPQGKHNFYELVDSKNVSRFFDGNLTKESISLDFEVDDLMIFEDGQYGLFHLNGGGFVLHDFVSKKNIGRFNFFDLSSMTGFLLFKTDTGFYISYEDKYGYFSLEDHQFYQAINDAGVLSVFKDKDNADKAVTWTSEICTIGQSNSIIELTDCHAIHHPKLTTKNASQVFLSQSGYLRAVYFKDHGVCVIDEALSGCRIFISLERYDDYVDPGVGLSPDGKTLVLMNEGLNNKVLVVDAETGEVNYELLLDSSGDIDITFSSDSNLILVHSSVWFDGKSSYRGMGTALQEEEAERLNDTISIWSQKTGKKLYQRRFDDYLTGVRFSPGNDTVLAVSENSYIIKPIFRLDNDASAIINKLSAWYKQK